MFFIGNKRWKSKRPKLEKFLHTANSMSSFLFMRTDKSVFTPNIFEVSKVVFGEHINDPDVPVIFNTNLDRVYSRSVGELTPKGIKQTRLAVDKYTIKELHAKIRSAIYD